VERRVRDGSAERLEPDNRWILDALTAHACVGRVVNAAVADADSAQQRHDARVVSLLAAEQMQPTLYRIAVRNSAKLYEFW